MGRWEALGKGAVRWVILLPTPPPILWVPRRHTRSFAFGLYMIAQKLQTQEHLPSHHRQATPSFLGLRPNLPSRALLLSGGAPALRVGQEAGAPWTRRLQSVSSPSSPSPEAPGAPPLNPVGAVGGTRGRPGHSGRGCGCGREAGQGSRTLRPSAAQRLHGGGALRPLPWRSRLRPIPPLEGAGPRPAPQRQRLGCGAGQGSAPPQGSCRTLSVSVMPAHKVGPSGHFAELWPGLNELTSL